MAYNKSKYSAEEKKAYFANKMDEAMGILQAGLKQLTDGLEWKNYLNTLCYFSKYSLRNTVMIYAQCPDATYVAGFSAWKEMGRSVNKGEKGIKIFAPIEVKRTDPKTGEETKETSFRVVHVFDVSQTSPIPGAVIDETKQFEPKIPVPITGECENLSDYIAALQDLTGYEIMKAELDDGSFGCCSYIEKLIVLSDNNSISDLHRLKTLIHETAHVLLHSDENLRDFIEVDFDKGVRETEAESVAFVVCSQLGIKTADYSFPYIGQYIDQKVTEKSITRIKDCASKILDHLANTPQLSLNHLLPSAASPSEISAQAV